MQVNPLLDLILWTFDFFADIMRHFAGLKAGNWVSQD